jgi:hypothetical protein
MAASILDHIKDDIYRDFQLIYLAQLNKDIRQKPYNIIIVSMEECKTNHK